MSHIGEIIMSTTLDTLAKVQAIYGSNTTWIQHSGYVLRGATSGVVANSATKTGGSDTHTITESELPSHTHSIPALSGTAASNGSHTHSSNSGYQLFTNHSTVVTFNPSGSFGMNPVDAATALKANGAHTHSVTTTASTTGAKGSGTAMSTLNSYKSVYIWERIA